MLEHRPFHSLSLQHPVFIIITVSFTIHIITRIMAQSFETGGVLELGFDASVPL